jgi:hypothetical protein
MKTVPVRPLPVGSRGFDTAASVSPAMAKAFAKGGYTFAIRYVRREAMHAYDVTTAELQTLVSAGLAVMLTQHVAPPGWRPTRELGEAYGIIAAQEAHKVGYLKGATLWCDLEGVAKGVKPEDVRAYANRWAYEVVTAGYHPGLYVGDACGLSGYDLYHHTTFSSYWAAYNTNLDHYPVVRGIQMKQKPYPDPSRRIAGAEFEYDEDLILVDALGGRCPAMTGPPAKV